MSIVGKLLEKSINPNGITFPFEVGSMVDHDIAQKIPLTCDQAKESLFANSLAFSTMNACFFPLSS